jgi:hypothetical protein
MNLSSSLLLFLVCCTTAPFYISARPGFRALIATNSPLTHLRPFAGRGSVLITHRPPPQTREDAHGRRRPFARAPPPDLAPLPVPARGRGRRRSPAWLHHLDGSRCVHCAAGGEGPHDGGGARGDGGHAVRRRQSGQGKTPAKNGTGFQEGWAAPLGGARHP